MAKPKLSIDIPERYLVGINKKEKKRKNLNFITFGLFALLLVGFFVVLWLLLRKAEQVHVDEKKSFLRKVVAANFVNFTEKEIKAISELMVNLNNGLTNNFHGWNEEVEDKDKKKKVTVGKKKMTLRKANAEKLHDLCNLTIKMIQHYLIVKNSQYLILATDIISTIDRNFFPIFGNGEKKSKTFIDLDLASYVVRLFLIYQLVLDDNDKDVDISIKKIAETQKICHGKISMLITKLNKFQGDDLKNNNIPVFVDIAYLLSFYWNDREKYQSARDENNPEIKIFRSRLTNYIPKKFGGNKLTDYNFYYGSCRALDLVEPEQEFQDKK